MFSLEQKGISIETFQKAVAKMDKEYRKQVAAAWRVRLREAAAYGRGLVSGLFGGRGKRVQRGFRYGVRTARNDVYGYVGYHPTKNKNSFWWLGRIYEGGGIIRNRSKSGRLFESGQRVSGASRRGRAMRRAGMTGSSKLWIPIASNRGGGGEAIVTPGQFFAEYRGRSVVKTGAGGNPIAYRREGGELIPMFVLKDQIPVKARPAATPTARKFLPIIQDATGEALFSNMRGLS